MKGVGLAFWAAAGLAQTWELGAGGGYGGYRNATVFSPAGSATAGIRSRFALTLTGGEDLYERVGGEIRYVYHDGDAFVGSTNAESHSHALHYDALFYTRPRGERWRPFIAVGGGVKRYVISAPAPTQPQARIASLRQASELQGLFTAGVGVKWRLRENLLLRLDARDYLTRFPKKIIVPGSQANPRGLLQQITFLAGISYVR